MHKLPPEQLTAAYWSIAGVSALLIFSFLLTSSVWMTAVMLVLGLLHVARHFPNIEAIIQSDSALVWLRRISPLIVIGIFAFMMYARSVR
ncbi:MAG: hypothetical protein Fur005_41360 [Roseiflexaceae bacterium]